MRSAKNDNLKQKWQGYCKFKSPFAIVVKSTRERCFFQLVWQLYFGDFIWLECSGDGKISGSKTTLVAAITKFTMKLVWTIIYCTRWWPVQARVHLAANEFKKFPQRHWWFIHNIIVIIVKIMHERIRLKYVRLNKMYKIFQNDPWSTVNWNSASHELYISDAFDYCKTLNFSRDLIFAKPPSWIYSRDFTFANCPLLFCNPYMINY